MAKIDLTSGEWEDYAPPQTQNTSMQKIDLSSGEWEDYTPSQPAPQEQSLGQKLDRRVSDIVEANKDYSLKGIAKNIFYPATAIKTAGAVAGGIGDVIGAGLSAAYEGLVPENIQKGISEKLPSLLSPIAPAIKGVTEAYGSFKQSYPEQAKELEAGANILSLLPVGKGAYLGKQVAGRGIEAASLSMAKQKGADIFRQEARNTIKTEFPKIFKMPSSLKKDYRASKQFLEKADNSMYDIVKNEHPDFPIKGKGNEPLTNLAENLVRREDEIWSGQGGIKEMIQRTGVNSQIDQTPFIEELNKRAKVLANDASGVATKEKDAIATTKVRLQKNPSISLGDAQDALQGLNKKLGGAIPYDVAGEVSVDNMYRNFLKKSSNSFVEALPDNMGFKDLKKLWGSHREVEDTIIKTLNDSLGKSQKLNFIDITSGSLALSAILTANPNMLLSVGMGEALNIARRLSGDINRSLVKLTDRVRKSQTMESKVREALSKNKPKPVPPLPPKQIGYESPTVEGRYGQIANPTRPINLGMEDISSVNGLKAKVNNPAWFSKNKGLIETLLEKKIRKPETEAEFNRLFYDIRTRMQGGTTRKDWATKPQKPLSSLEHDFWGTTDLDKGKGNYKDPLGLRGGKP